MQVEIGRAKRIGARARRVRTKSRRGRRREEGPWGFCGGGALGEVQQAGSRKGERQEKTIQGPEYDTCCAGRVGRGGTDGRGLVGNAAVHGRLAGRNTVVTLRRDLLLLSEVGRELLLVLMRRKRRLARRASRCARRPLRARLPATAAPETTPARLLPRTLTAHIVAVLLRLLLLML